MRLLSRAPIWIVGVTAVCTILIVTMHIGGTFALRIGQFFPLLVRLLVAYSFLRAYICLVKLLLLQPSPGIGESAGPGP